jgi:glucose dehydrogenase
MSYRLASGEQLVAIAVGGGEEFGKGDYVIAFHLLGPKPSVPAP